MTRSRLNGGILGLNNTTSLTSAYGVFSAAEQAYYLQASKWPTAAGPFNINNSLRFRAGASTNLNRTPGVSGSTTAWTMSFWVKSGSTSNTSFFAAGSGQGNGTATERMSLGSTLYWQRAVIQTANVYDNGSTAVLRDYAAWYHIVMVWDSNNATAALRQKYYVNGVLATNNTGTTASLGQSSIINSSINHRIGLNYDTGTSYGDFYLAEFNFIDGQILTASSFGVYDVNGIWQPIKYTGTYGTNGYYLNFSNTTSTTTLGNDNSGNGNNWTVNNFSLTAGTTYDAMTDSPVNVSATIASYPTLNPLIPGLSLTYSNANLTETNATGTWYNTRATMAYPSTGKFYYEQICTAGVNCWAGVGNANTLTSGNPAGYDANSYGFSNSGQKFNNSTGTAYGNSFTTNDTIGVAFDAAAGSVYFAKNGVWQNSANPAAGTGYAFTGLTGPIFPLSSSSGSGATVTQSYNFGQQPFTYSPPSGFVALNTYNLVTPTIPNGAAYFAATLYTGTGNANGDVLTVLNSNNNTSGTTFQPDLVWAKTRAGAGGTSTNWQNILADSLRGTSSLLNSDSAAAEYSGGGITAFGSNGFTAQRNTAYNQNNVNTWTYVGWQWRAGNGVTATNTNGTITSTTSVNQTAGFSIVSYTGNQTSGATVGHGLGVAPSMIIIKSRTNATDGWVIYHVSVGNTKALFFDTTTGTTQAAYFNNTSPGSSVFTLGFGTGANNSTPNIAYCWAPITGFSSFGSYTGTGANPGPFVYLGFRPRWIMFKNASATGDWVILDTSRDPVNQFVPNSLLANTSAVEANNNTWQIDALSNGMSIRNTSTTINGSTNSIIYAAFAENPFNTARAR